MARNRSGPAVPVFDFSPEVYNDAEETAPAQGLIEIVDVLRGRALLKGQKPSLTGLTRFGVLPLSITARCRGPIQLVGQVRVTVAKLSGETIAAGKTRVGPIAGQWKAGVYDLGPMRVESVISSPADDEAGDAVVVATITGRRGDHQFIVNNDESVAKPFQVVKVGIGLTLTETNPGENSLAYVT